MIIYEKFLPILVQANEMSPFISGQLFMFVIKDQKFSTVSKHKTPNGFIIRWILLLLISFTFLYRVINSKLANAHSNSQNDIAVEPNIVL